MKKINWPAVLGFTLIVLLALLSLICVGWTIYAFVKYGGKPIDEIPSWALWFMFR